MDLKKLGLAELSVTESKAIVGGYKWYDGDNVFVYIGYAVYNLGCLVGVWGDRN